MILSEKHGLNPSVIHCYYCHEAMGIALHRRLPYDEEAPRAILDPDRHPCDKCKEHMKMGIKLVEADGMDTWYFVAPRDQPKRGGNIVEREGRKVEAIEVAKTTGRSWVVREDAVRAWPDSEAKTNLLRTRMGFVDPETAKAIGLYEKMDDR